VEKKKFTNLFLDEDPSIISSLYDKLELCKKIDGIVYSDVFLPPQVWSRLIDLENELGVIVDTKGLSNDSEKKMVAFSSYYTNDILKFPIKFIKIETNSKFYTFEHRHFLASILSTGLKREKLGDLIVEDGNGFTAIYSGLFDFLTLHLLSIGKSKVTLKEIESFKIPASKFKKIDFLLSSLRLDLIVSVLTNSSRSDGLKLINSSQVMVNYRIKTYKSLMIKENDVISIRKYGKFIFLGSDGESRKGKLKGKFKKYI
jgi:RNA-binding protein YlmH